MRIMLFLLLIGFQVSFGQPTDFSKVRTNLVKGVTNKAICKSTADALRLSNDVLAQGYYGVFTMMMAKHTVNPFKKLSYFQSGKKILEQSLRTAPDNVELRFLRLSLQYNLPAFLNYNSDINRDREFIVGQFPKIDESDLKKLIAGFLLSGDVLTEKQKNQIAKT